MNATTRLPRVARLAAIGFLTLGLAACSSGPDTMSDNSGKSVTTRQGEQLKESMFLGKWDLDGERTNTANGANGVAAIPADVVKDVLGKGWRFDAGGVMKTDMAVGWKTGSWRIEGKDTLVVNEGNGEQKYTAHFQDGFLHLKKADGKFVVFERDRFFGF